MLLGSFNPEKNIAYLDYKELNPTNKEKHDEIFKQMKVHYANYLDALEGSKNKNLDYRNHVFSMFFTLYWG